MKLKDILIQPQFNRVVGIFEGPNGLDDIKQVVVPIDDVTGVKSVIKHFDTETQKEELANTNLITIDRTATEEPQTEE